MRLTILCVGSHGDIRPYIALGIGLKERGHEVTIGSHQKAKSLCDQYHLKFVLVDGDLTELIGAERGHDILWGSKGKKALQFFGIMQEFNKALKMQLPSSLEATMGADILIYSPAAFAGPHLGEYFGIPSYLINLQPEVRTKYHPSFFFEWLKYGGKIGCLLSHFLSEQQLWQPIRKEVNRWRVSQLGLKKMHFLGPKADKTTKDNPVIVAFSPSLVPRPRDWSKNIIMTTFLRVAEGQAWIPPQALSDFLSSGPILYLGFGSLTEACHPSIVQKMLSVLRKRKIKTVIQVNFPSLVISELPPWIYPLTYAPHDWLFPKVSAVIHHGGVGTMAAGLYAGKPTFIIPFIVDQSTWGSLIGNMKMGPQPLPAFSFDETLFEERLLDLLSNPEYAEQARNIQSVLEGEKDGVERTIETILNAREN
ncbi:MAG: glycosyltransferase family 1 protein [Simkaniaceae bacterium]|nr:glycosyltransferase family 1 protein [Simkaniaceae bacterium]